MLKRLILGSGKFTPKYNDDQFQDTFLDIVKFENVDIVHDLNKTPWPVKEFDEISAMHVVEHLNSLVSFMNECHRVLKPGGSLYLETPCAGMDLDLEFADPTHIRCYRPHSFINYFTLSGVSNFGYTDKAWSIFKIAVERNCIIFHGQPIK